MINPTCLRARARCTACGLAKTLHPCHRLSRSLCSRANASVQVEDSDPDSSKSEVQSGRQLLSHTLNDNFATDELFEELKDRDGFGKRGELVLASQVIVMALVVFPPMQLKGIVYLGGVLAMIAGGVASLYSIVCLGRSFSPLVSPRRNNALVTTGMYQYMRHPLYAGCILLAFGLAATTYSESRLVLSCLFFCVVNYKAKQEETAMLEKHGKLYEEYMQQVSRFIPSL